MYTLPLLLLLVAQSVAQRADGQFYPCNPLVNGTGVCTPNPGLNQSTYFVDFTKQTSLPPNWTIANYETVTYGPNGAEFTFAKRYDAPQIWTNFYILFGSVSTIMQAAPGAGIISNSVLISDDEDEIDWEFGGGWYVGNTGMGQNNYFGKGITGNYDRGVFFGVPLANASFHNYTVSWTPNQLQWLLDGSIIRTLYSSSCTTANGSMYQYPQSPSKIQLGLWDGGDPAESVGTQEWAGGVTNISAAPYTMYVKSIRITNLNPAWAYNWTDTTGSWQSIQKLMEPPHNLSVSASSSLISAISAASTAQPANVTLAMHSATTNTSASATALTSRSTTSISIGSSATVGGSIAAQSTSAGGPTVGSTLVSTSISIIPTGTKLSSSSLSSIASSSSTLSSVKLTATIVLSSKVILSSVTSSSTSSHAVVGTSSASILSNGSKTSSSIVLPPTLSMTKSVSIATVVTSSSGCSKKATSASLSSTQPISTTSSASAAATTLSGQALLNKQFLAWLAYWRGMLVAEQHLQGRDE